MRFLRVVLPLAVALLIGSIKAQDSPRRDVQAIAVIQESLTLMGGRVPDDSIATGTVDIVEGSRQESGTVRFLTRGTDQTAEHFQLASGDRALVYSRLSASRLVRDEEPEGLEFALTAQSGFFPPGLFSAALSDPDTALTYLGLEQLDGVSVHHLRVWNTFASSSSRLQQLAEYSVRDIWIDALSGLPAKMEWEQRIAGGSADRTRVETFFGDYQNVGGILCPFSIRRSINGTLWADIRIQQMRLNVGLNESYFAVDEVQP